LSGGWGDAFSVRWRGALVPPVDGSYKLGASGFSGYRLVLDGEVIAEYEGVHHAILKTQEVELEASRVYDLELEYVNRGLDPQVQLLWAVPGQDYLSQAVQVAGKAEVVIVVLGLSPRLEGEEMPVQVPGFAGGDRTDIGLPGPQQELLERIHALGKPTVVVLLNGSALGLAWLAEHVPAIVEAWYPGEEGGTAIAEVLFGDYNPGGRLPVTFYRSVEDLPPFDDYDMEGHTYRYFRGEPVYAFGHGLSYTTFGYGNLQLSAPSIAPGGALNVTVDVRNTGQRAGDEVVQLYLSDVEASVPVPIRQLVGFTRVHLEPGETRTVSFTVEPEQFAVIDDAGQRVIEPGRFRLSVGGRQPRSEELT
jgi:beta-glucosidase